MTPNDDLARWGEPPATEAELALANLLADALASPTQPAVPDPHLLETSGWIEDMVETVLTHVGPLEALPLPAASAGPRIDLRLRVLREVGPSRYQPIASTHPQPMVLRDLRRVPADADRVTLRTGDRVRLEMECDRDGYLTVFNIGPAGTLNVLYPDDGPGAALRAGAPLVIADVEMTPPAGRERVYAIWSRVPQDAGRLARLVRPGVVLRDMQRVQETLQELRPEDWHAVMLELDHAG
jgi:hypothetical protein